jgi:hypothetical protein
MAARRLRLRYPGTCSICAANLPKGTDATWDSDARAATCLACSSVEIPIDRGTPGGSAQREGEARRERREARVRSAYPRIGGLLLRMYGAPQSERAWSVGAEGERVVGSWLNSITDVPIAVLHDRRIPKSKANIDHVAIVPSAIWVIDAKRYQGRVQYVNRGSWLRPDYRLVVGRRDCSKLVAAMARQVAAVRQALPPGDETPIRSALCFSGAEWGLFDQPFMVDDVAVTWAKPLTKVLRQAGPLTPDVIETLERRIGLALPAA